MAKKRSSTDTKAWARSINPSKKDRRNLSKTKQAIGKDENPIERRDRLPTAIQKPRREKAIEEIATKIVFHLMESDTAFLLLDDNDFNSSIESLIEDTPKIKVRKDDIDSNSMSDFISSIVEEITLQMSIIDDNLV